MIFSNQFFVFQFFQFFRPFNNPKNHELYSIEDNSYCRLSYILENNFIWSHWNLLDVDYKNNQIYHLTLTEEAVIFLKRQKKKFSCVSVTTILNNAVCKLHTNAYYLINKSLRFDGESFELVNKSKCDHRSTYALANHRGSPFVTGSDDERYDCLVKTEIYNFGTNQWNDAPDYPNYS